MHLHCETLSEHTQEVLGSVFPHSQQSKKKSWISDATLAMVKVRQASVSLLKRAVLRRNMLDVGLCLRTWAYRDAGIGNQTTLRKCSCTTSLSWHALRAFTAGCGLKLPSRTEPMPRLAKRCEMCPRQSFAKTFRSETLRNAASFRRRRSRDSFSRTWRRQSPWNHSP